mmetsp:Transcript_14050/g.20792  ORF Transcript_14050/g.20792 Transcript_14050/m.20792 type:complete len:730 (-) Transcript_14050:241-2430(-)
MAGKKKQQQGKNKSKSSSSSNRALLQEDQHGDNDNNEPVSKMMKVKQQARRKPSSLQKFLAQHGLKIFIAIVAFIASAHYSNLAMMKTLSSLTPKQKNLHHLLTSFVCDATDDQGKKIGYCHEALEPHLDHRTHTIRDGHQVRKGEIIMILPRHLLINDLDAVQDPWTKKNLLGAKHGTHDSYIFPEMHRLFYRTFNYVDAGAYLAAYCVRRHKLAFGNWTRGVSAGEPIYIDSVDDHMLPFFEVLPTFSDLKESHPTLWSDDFLHEQFGSWKCNVMGNILAFRTMIFGEYEAFCMKSVEFCANVKPEEFIAMRINVLSRSFGMGPAANAIVEEEAVSKPEFDKLKRMNVHFDKGMRAMAPVLDMWDHHPRANSQWVYNGKDRAFVITATGSGFSPGSEVMVSYGKFTETHLFTKFGFINGDGSGWTEASVSAFHQLIDFKLEPQFAYLPMDKKKKLNTYMWDGWQRKGQNPRDLLHYLKYDDIGESYCIDVKNPSHEAQSYLKGIKFRIMQTWTRDRNRWTVNASPRNLKAKPPRSSYDPPSDPLPPRLLHGSLKFKMTSLLDTCMLIALSPADFKGKATELMANVVSKERQNYLKISKDMKKEHGQTKGALTHRSLVCLRRLSQSAMSLYPRTIFNERNHIKTLVKDGKFRSREWTAAHVRLSELETLEGVYNNTLEQLDVIEKEKDRKVKELQLDSVDHVLMKTEPCPDRLAFDDFITEFERRIIK